MNFCWRDGVVTRQDVAGQNRERKRLVARAVEVAAGKLVILIERVVDLGDQTIDVIRSGRGDKKIRLAGVVEERQRSIWRGPRIARQQPRDHGIGWAAKRGDLAWVGNARR